VQVLAFLSWKNLARRIARARTEVVMRWCREQQFRLSIGFHCWAMLCRVGRHPRLRSALELASRAQQELQLSQLAWSQRLSDAEAAWENRIAQEQAAKEAALHKADVNAANFQRSKAVLDDTLGLLQQVEADREMLTQKMKKRELGESERMKQHLHDLHRKIDEDAGLHEADLHALMAKEQENECLRQEVESLRSQVCLFQIFYRLYILIFALPFS
jgi:hypothetical protein